MSDMNTSVDHYLDAWNDTDDASRQQKVAKLWIEEGRYVDPLADATGHETISATIGAVQQQFPGFTFRRLGTADTHHNVVRFAWELGPDGVEAPIAGFDVAVLAPDGRIEAVHGFLDKVPAA